MAGFLSKVFEPEPQDSSAVQRAPAEDGTTHADHAGEGTESSNSTDMQADAGLEVTIPVHIETSVEYETADGTAGWSHATDVALTVSTSAVLGAASDAGFSEDDAAY